MYDLYNDIEAALSELKTDSFHSSQFRQDYEQQVEALSDYVDQLKDMGLEEEDIAHILYNKRQAMAHNYQEHAPVLIKEYINDFVYAQHHSALGLTFDQMKETLSYEEMIKTLSSVHGNLDMWVTLDHFLSWLKKNYIKEVR